MKVTVTIEDLAKCVDRLALAAKFTAEDETRALIRSVRDYLETCGTEPLQELPITY